MVPTFFGSGLPNLLLQTQITGINAQISGSKSKAKFDNLVQFIEMFNRFTNLAITRFNWTGLPTSMHERFINICMFFYGAVAVFEDETLGVCAMPYTDSGEYNWFYEPTRIRPFSLGYEGRELNYGEFEIIRNNPTATPTCFTTWVYTEKLSDILRTIDTELKRLKHPWAIMAEEKQRMTILNLFKDIDDNEPLVIGVPDYFKGMKDKPVLSEILDLKKDSELKTLWETFNSLLSYLYTLYGIENTNMEKRERLITDEVNANNMVTDLNLETQLKEYREGCKRVNEHFGLNIGVEATDVSAYKEGGINGEVHNRTPNTDTE